jgi:hypothetical protein
MYQFFKFSLRKYSSIGSGNSIYAVASGTNQKCGISVVRLSGVNTQNVLLKLTNKKSIDNYEPRKMYLTDICHPLSKVKIDKSLVVWFKGIVVVVNLKMNKIAVLEISNLKVQIVSRGKM